MKYIYTILAHTPEDCTLQVKLSCVDTPHTGVVQMQYPTEQGIPVFSDARLLEDVIRYFRGDLNSWEIQENNKFDIAAITVEADAVVGKTQSFDHTLLEDDWLEDDLDGM